MGIVLTSFARALPAPPFRLRRDTIPPHDPSGPFADHPCVRFTRLRDNDSVTRRRKSPGFGMGHLLAFETGLTLRSAGPQQHHMSVYIVKDDRMSSYHRVTD